MMYNNNNKQPPSFNKNSYSSVNNGMSIYNPTYDQFIIKPPERNKTHGRISDKLVIDSRDRDTIIYPKPNKYRYNIKDEYKDIISVELVLADIPNSVYNINEGNNQIILNSGDDATKLENCIKFTLPVGEYTNQRFLDVLNGSKGNLFEIFTDTSNNGAYFNFYEDPDTNLIKIQSNKPFSFNLDYDIGDKFIKCNQGDINKYYESIGYNSIDRTLGFDRKLHTAEQKFNGNSANNELPPSVTITAVSSSLPTVDGFTVYEITTDNSVDVRQIYSKGDYIEIGGNLFRVYKTLNKTMLEVLSVGGAIAVGGDTITAYWAIYGVNAFELGCPKYVILDIPQFHMLKADQTSIDDAYAVIPLRDGCKTIVDSGAISLDKEIKYFNPPLASLRFIDIKFCDYYNKLVNFKGVDHMLAFRITSLNQPGKYNNLNENLF